MISPLPGDSQASDSYSLNQIASILDDLAGLVRRFPVTESAPGSPKPSGSSRDAVERLIKQRSLRASFFPSDWFSDPAWDVLLFLYLNHLTGSSVTVGDVGYGAGLHPSTTIRWIDIIHGAGLIARTRSVEDNRRVFISLTPDGVEAMSRYVGAAL